MTVGEKIRALMEERGLYTKDVAERMGVTYQYLWSLLHDRSKVGPKAADKLSKVFPDYGPRYWLFSKYMDDVDVP
jgi:transcriptional regulator with XRE-family HTH domain